MLGCNKAIILILLKKIVTGKLTFHDRYLPLLRARAAADALVLLILGPVLFILLHPHPVP